MKMKIKINDGCPPTKCKTNIWNCPKCIKTGSFDFLTDFEHEEYLDYYGLK